MDGSGDEFFACTCFTGNQNRRVGRSDFGNSGKDRPQRCRGADNLLEHRSLVDLLAKDDVFLSQSLFSSLAVFNVDGEYYVLDDLCTHGPGSLSEGYIEGDVVECNFHNGQFNIRTGEVVLPPCMIPMKTYPTMVENGKIVIEV